MARWIVFTDSGFWKYSWFSNVNDRIMLMSDAVSSEGPKTTGIQQRTSGLSLTHRDFSSFSESFFASFNAFNWFLLFERCEKVRRIAKLFSNTNDNKKLSIHSYPGDSSSVFVYTGFRNSATILTLLCNSSCSGHVILAQIWLDGPCSRFAKLKRFVRLDEKKKHLRSRFAVFVEASIGSCCFIPACHHVRNSFCFFALSVERPSDIPFIANHVTDLMSINLISF